MTKMQDPWRYRCPEGHSSWRRSSNERYFCQQCRESFDELRDMKRQ